GAVALPRPGYALRIGHVLTSSGRVSFHSCDAWRRRTVAPLPARAYRAGGAPARVLPREGYADVATAFRPGPAVGISGEFEAENEDGLAQDKGGRSGVGRARGRAGRGQWRRGHAGVPATGAASAGAAPGRARRCTGGDGRERAPGGVRAGAADRCGPLRPARQDDAGHERLSRGRACVARVLLQHDADETTRDGRRDAPRVYPVW